MIDPYNVTPADKINNHTFLSICIITVCVVVYMLRKMHVTCRKGTTCHVGFTTPADIWGKVLEILNPCE